eukprot:276497-Amphidinium_carterae.1
MSREGFQLQLSLAHVHYSKYQKRRLQSLLLGIEFGKQVPLLFDSQSLEDVHAPKPAQPTSIVGSPNILVKMRTACTPRMCQCQLARGRLAGWITLSEKWLYFGRPAVELLCA